MLWRHEVEFGFRVYVRDMQSTTPIFQDMEARLRELAGELASSVQASPSEDLYVPILPEDEGRHQQEGRFVVQRDGGPCLVVRQVLFVVGCQDEADAKELVSHTVWAVGEDRFATIVRRAKALTEVVAV